MDGDSQIGRLRQQEIGQQALFGKPLFPVGKQGARKKMALLKHRGKRPLFHEERVKRFSGCVDLLMDRRLSSHDKRLPVWMGLEPDR
jgi:hypothetical protein